MQLTAAPTRYTVNQQLVTWCIQKHPECVMKVCVCVYLKTCPYQLPWCVAAKCVDELTPVWPVVLLS